MIRKNVVVVIIFLALILTVAIRWSGLSGENYRSIISSDGLGYYHYYISALDSVGFANQKVNATYLVKTPDSRVVNKYFVGLPILWSPFILPVYSYYSIVNQNQVDFYAEGFQKAVSLAALFYLFFGLFAMKKLLQTFNIEQRIVNFRLFAFFFGTNLSYYTIIAPSMSHVYSFALISGFLYFVRLYSLKQLPKHLIYGSLLFALIVLVRPVNGLILMAVPIVWKSRSPYFQLIKTQFKVVVAVVIMILLIVAIQPLFWYLQTGSIVQWSYAGEGFYFTNPKIFDFVLSFRKGFLVYTPILLFSLISIIVILKKYKQRALFLFIFILVLIYILSSWWSWYYGDSFGSRVMIDFYPIFILLFSLGLQNLKFWHRINWLVFSMFFIVLNLFQSYQYYHNIMSHYDMNAEKYRYIFFKAGTDYENCLGGNDDIAPYHKQALKLLYEISSDTPSSIYRISCGKSGNINDTTQPISVKVEERSFPCSISLFADSLMNYRALYAEMECVTISKNSNLNDVYWTASIRGSKEQSHYYAFRINGTPERINGLRTDKYRFSLPVPKVKSEEVLISLWNKGKKDFNILSINIKVYGIID